MTVIKATIASVIFKLLQGSVRVGEENHDSVLTIHKEQNFKPLDISRTVPCIIASWAYRALF